MTLPRIRLLRFALGAGAIAFAAIVATDQFSVFKIREMQSRIDELEREKARLLLYAKRISTSRRVAQVNVIAQDRDAVGGPVTVLHWQQVSPEGLLGPMEVLTLRGTQVYFEAMVAKFDYDLIGNEAPGRSTNLAVFRRAFGDGQAPSGGQPLDTTAPTLVDTSGSALSVAPDAAIWSRFWEIVEKPDLAREFGIRVAQCEAPSVPVKPGQVWEVSLDAAGGLNLKKIGDRAVPKEGPGISAPPNSLIH